MEIDRIIQLFIWIVNLTSKTEQPDIIQAYMATHFLERSPQLQAAWLTHVQKRQTSREGPAIPLRQRQYKLKKIVFFFLFFSSFNQSVKRWSNQSNVCAQMLSGKSYTIVSFRDSVC